MSSNFNLTDDSQSHSPHLMSLRPSIQGYVTLKRKESWVKRFAVIDGPTRSFKYRNYYGDKTDKFVLSLAKEDSIIIKKGMRNKKTPYFTIEKKVGRAESLRGVT